MKTLEQVLITAVTGCALTISAWCASPPKYSGFMGDYYKNLQPGPKGGAKLQWLKPGVDFSKYSKFMIDRLAFYCTEDSEDKGINAEEMQQLTDALTREIVNALKDRYPIVGEPGPDVARLRVALTNVRKTNRPIADITTAMPRERRISVTRDVLLNTWTGPEEARAELMVVDSSTNEVIAAAMDEVATGFSDIGIKEAFKYWAGRIRGFVDSAGGSKP